MIDFVFNAIVRFSIMAPKKASKNTRKIEVATGTPTEFELGCYSCLLRGEGGGSRERWRKLKGYTGKKRGGTIGEETKDIMTWR